MSWHVPNLFRRVQEGYERIHTYRSLSRGDAQRESYAASEHEQLCRIAGDIAYLKLTVATLVQMLIRSDAIGSAELAGACSSLIRTAIARRAATSKRENSMPEAGHIVDAYLDKRDKLYRQVAERMDRRQTAAAGLELGKDHIEGLQDDLAELKLVVASIMELLVRDGTLSVDELRQQAERLDRLDGAADGKLHGHVEPDGSVGAEVRERTPLDDLTDALENP